MSEGALSLWQHLTSPRVLLLSIVPLPCLSVSTLGRGGGPVSLRVSPFGEESTTFFRLNFSGGSKLGDPRLSASSLPPSPPDPAGELLSGRENLFLREPTTLSGVSRVHLPLLRGTLFQT